MLYHSSSAGMAGMARVAGVDGGGANGTNGSSIGFVNADSFHWVLWTVSIVFGLTMASIFPTAVSFAETYIPVSGKIASILVIGASIGEGIIPQIMGNTMMLGASVFGWVLLSGAVGLAALLFVTFKLGERVAAGKDE